MAERQVGHWKSCLVLSEPFPSSTDVPVLLLNQPKNISLGPRKGGCVRLIEKTAVCILYLIKTYNRRQNVLRHFILNWIFFYLLLTSKGGKISFPPLIPSMQCCAAVRATYRKQQTPQLWIEGTTGGVWILLFSEVTLFEYNISTIAKCHETVILLNSFVRIFQKMMIYDITRVISKTEE